MRQIGWTGEQRHMGGVGQMDQVGQIGYIGLNADSNYWLHSGPVAVGSF